MKIIDTNKIVHSYWLVIIAFLLMLGPLSLNYHFYYPDELHYSDAAIQMVKTGDYLTPLQGNGEFRFNKPILTYWFIVLGYKLFGISAFATRFFFLLSGAFLLFIVHKIGILVSGNKKTAYLGTVIAATQITIIISSIRAIPDILLCLFMTISIWGLCGILKYGNKSPKKYLWLAYLGLAMAVQVKGIAALALGFSALLFLLANPWQRIKAKTLFHFPSLSIAIIIAFSWFVVMITIHGSNFTQSFFNDQVGERVSLDVLSVVKNIFLATLLFIPLFIFWIPMLKKKYFNFHQLQTEQKAFQAFVLIMTLTIILLSGLVFKFYERYLLPVFPLFAVWLAILLNQDVEFNKKPFLKFLFLFSLLVNLIAWPVSAYLHLSIGCSAWMMSLLIAIPVILFVLLKITPGNENIIPRIAFVFLLVFLNGSMLSAFISFPTEGDQLSKVIAKDATYNNETIGFIGKRQVASLFRVCSNGNYNVINLGTVYNSQDIDQYHYLIGDSAFVHQLPITKYKIETGSVVWDEIKPLQILKSIYQGEYTELKNNTGEKYYWIANKQDN